MRRPSDNIVRESRSQELFKHVTYFADMLFPDIPEITLSGVKQPYLLRPCCMDFVAGVSRYRLAIDHHGDRNAQTALRLVERMSRFGDALYVSFDAIARSR